MFLSRNKKNNVYPCKPQFYYIKVGFNGVKIILACFSGVVISYLCCSKGSHGVQLKIRLIKYTPANPYFHYTLLENKWVYIT